MWHVHGAHCLFLVALGAQRKRGRIQMPCASVAALARACIHGGAPLAAWGNWFVLHGACLQEVVVAAPEIWQPGREY